jgi:hypothetical protein
VEVFDKAVAARVPGLIPRAVAPPTLRTV